jgi:hypothetical protein
MQTHYTMSADGLPVVQTDINVFLAWWLTTRNRMVSYHELENGWRVETVFMGVVEDVAGEPHYFSTVVADRDGTALEQSFSVTRADALALHEALVTTLQSQEVP